MQTDQTELNGTVTVPFQIDFDVAGPASYFSSSSWSPSIVPTSTDEAYIRNGGTATATSGGPVEAFNLTVAAEAGNGTLNIDEVASFFVGEDFEFSRNNPASKAFQGSSTLASTAEIRNVGTLDIREDLEISLANDGNWDGPTLGTFDCDANITFAEIGTVIIDEDLEISTMDYVKGGGQRDLDATVTFSDIDSLTVVDEDFEVALCASESSESDGDTFGTYTADATVYLTDVDTLSVGEDFDIGLAYAEEGTDSSNSSSATATGTAILQNVAASAGNAVRVGYVSPNEEADDPPAPNANVTANCTLDMTASSLDSPRVAVGWVMPNATGTANGTLELNPSYVETDLFELGPGGELVMHIGGGTRVTPGTVGDTNTYAAVNAVDAVLEGTIVAQFDYWPYPGTNTYDLIVTDSLSALDDTTASFEVSDLNPGYTLEFFGVVEDGTDIVRLTISGSPAGITIPTLSQWSLALLAMLLAAAGWIALRQM